MKKNKYEIIVETCDERATLEVKGGRFTANKVYKFCCKYANTMTEDIYAVFLVKNDSVVKQYYID